MFRRDGRLAFSTHWQTWIARDAKEKNKKCYIALDFDTEMKEATESSDKEMTGGETPDHKSVAKNQGW